MGEQTKNERQTETGHTVVRMAVHSEALGELLQRVITESYVIRVKTLLLFLNTRLDMKHGHAFRKFSRTSSHRNLMLRYVSSYVQLTCVVHDVIRNLVTSLFEHEQIRTTLPKAKDTARLAEKVST